MAPATSNATKPAPVKVGVIGCGNICKQYFTFAKQFPILEMAACADIDPARAEAAASEHEVYRACTVEELLADEAIEVVLNLTVPAAHGPVGLADGVLEAVAG